MAEHRKILRSEMELKDLQRLFMKLFLIILTAILIAPCTALAMPEIFPFDRLQNGMTGKAYTVVDSSGKIENFDVQIVGFTNESKGTKRYILAKASGEVVKRTGGILQGMSGSPFYIDGKLVGALAATLKDMDTYTVLITPIEDMLELWNLPDPKAQVNFPRRISVDSEKADENKPAEDASANDDSADKSATLTDKLTVPEVEKLNAFYLSGFDVNGAQFLQQELKPFGLNNLQTSSKNIEHGLDFNATLEPGSALGVAIVYGDFSLGATGTVTAVDDKKILAFGHSFMHSGNVNYFMTDASVIGSISGLTGNGVKVADVKHIIGRVNQDRDSGIAGTLGTFPAVVPVTVNVKNNESNKQESFNVVIAYNENLIPKLGATVAYGALSRMADSLAESTVDFEFCIKTNVVEGGKFVRKNVFYNGSDVGQVAVVELMQALNLICSNTKEESNIFGVDVNIAFDTERRTASIIDITPEKKNVKPGETVNLVVELQPYRKPVEKVIVPYTVPLTVGPGLHSLEIHGGGLVPVNQSASSGTISADSNQSYEDKIKKILNAGRNNQLVVEVVSSGTKRTDKEIRKGIAQAKRLQERLKKEGKTFKKSDSKVDTNYIIDNVMRTTFNVEKV